MLFLPVLLGLWAERAIRRWRPLWLAPFACIPVGRRRRIALSTTLAAEVRCRAERTYRQNAAGDPDPARLPLLGRLDGARLTAEGDLAVVTSPSHSGLARIDVRLDHDVAVLSARCLPVPLSLAGCSLVVLLAARGSLLLTALAVAIPLFTSIASIRRLRPHVEQAMDEIARQLGEA